MTFLVVCVKLLMMKPNKKTQITIYILSFLQQFLNTNFNNLYKYQRNNVRKHYNIPATETLWFNGFDYKTIIFINNNRCFEVYRVPIQRMIWSKSSGERVHIYLRPSFVIKHCPFSLCTLEFIRNAGIPCETELFEMIKDPENLLDSSFSLEYYIKKISKILGSSEYMIKWNNLHYKTFYTLSPEAEKVLLSPDLSPPMRTYHLIRLCAEGVGLKVLQHEHLSFANFQFPLN